MNANINQGLILCSGSKSNALYAVSYVIRNMGEFYEDMRKEEEKLKLKEKKEREELEEIKEYNQ
jgi:hypothetical protein